MWKWVVDTFPIAEWGRTYGQSEWRGDLMAGLTVGVMLIPQSMAYAVLAGMPPIYGLYASLVPLLVYPFLGTSRHLAIGVIAIDMIIISAGVSSLAEPGSARYVSLVVALAALVGLLQLGMAALQMGFLASLLSRPVIAGFTGAAALIIGFSQLGNLTGIDLARTEYVYELIWEAAQRLEEVHLLSLLLGLSCVVLLVGIRYWAPLFPSALAVVSLSMLASWGLGLEGKGVELTGPVPSGLPGLAVPSLSPQNLRDLVPTAVTLALVQFMSVISLGRAFSSRNQYSIRPNWELLAVGGANLVGSLFRAIPVSSSFSRTAVNEEAGAKTPLANVVAASLVGLTLLVLTPLFYYLPMPALAAIIIVAAVGLIDLEELSYLFQVKERDGYVAIFTFVTTLLIGIQEGILMGIGASAVAVLYRTSRPHVAELGHIPGTHSFRNVERFPEATTIEGLLVLRIDAEFTFFNATYFKDYILGKSKNSGPPIRAVILDGTGMNDLDTTALETLREVVSTLHEEGIEVYLSGLKGQVRDIVQDSELHKVLGQDNFPTSVNRAVKHVLSLWDAQEGGERHSLYVREAEQEVPPEKRMPEEL